MNDEVDDSEKVALFLLPTTRMYFKFFHLKESSNAGIAFHSASRHQNQLFKWVADRRRREFTAKKILEHVSVTSP
jgi:hypothetical protein